MKIFLFKIDIISDFIQFWNICFEIKLIFFKISNKYLIIKNEKEIIKEINNKFKLNNKNIYL